MIKNIPNRLFYLLTWDVKHHIIPIAISHITRGFKMPSFKRPDNPTLAEQLVLWRNDNCLSVAEAARLFSISLGRYWQWENGQIPKDHEAFAARFENAKLLLICERLRDV